MWKKITELFFGKEQKPEGPLDNGPLDLIPESKKQKPVVVKPSPKKTKKATTKPKDKPKPKATAKATAKAKPKAKPKAKATATKKTASSTKKKD